MPLMENGSALNYLAVNPSTSMAQRISWIADIAHGMAHLVKKNLIHGDLKADNVLIGSPG